MKNNKPVAGFSSISIIILSIIAIMLFTTNAYSQTAFSVKNSNDESYIYIDNNGNVAIDTSSILGSLTVGGNDGIISTGTYGSGNTLSLSGAGTRLMWYPKKAAFRVGIISSLYSDYWDDSNIGISSFASGQDTKASEIFSTAMGHFTTASGNTSTALGYETTASGDFSTAMGYYTTASGDYSTAMGDHTTASGDYSTAMGYYTTANGHASTAIGDSSIASGWCSFASGFRANAPSTFSIAMGYSTTAYGYSSIAIGSNVYTNNNYSMAIGYNLAASGYFAIAMGSHVENNGKSGSFIIGDNSTSTNTNSSAQNQMMMRFDGGYILYSNSSLTAGVTLSSGQNSWGIVSDSTKKYAFLPVNGESILNKLSKFNLRTWSYKGQDSTKFRHYGPMAQEFFAAFGHDKYGVIGNDTTINQADFEGINLIAIQALYKEINAQKKENEKLKSLVAELNKKLLEQRNRFADQQKQIDELNKMQSEFTELKNIINSIRNNNQTNAVMTITQNKK